VAAGGTTGQILSKASGTNYDTTWATIIPGDRYLTSSTTSLTIDNANKTLTIGTGLSYSPQQDVVISESTSPTTRHMHARVTSYNSGTGVMVVDIISHTGTGTYSSWVVNVGGATPVTSTAWGAITGTLSAQIDLQTALDLKAPLASPALTGTPTAPTATAGTSTTQLATTAFVTTANNLKANLASPTFTGTPAAPTATAGTNTTQLATTAFVTNGLSTKANLASPTFTGTVTIPAGASISGFAPLASPALTGTPTAPTATTATNTTQIATTAYVKAQGYATLASPTFTGTVTIPAGASISGYLTTSSAASTYQTLSGMSSYLTTSAAASTYQTLSGMSSYLTTSAAASTYQPIGSYLTDAPSDGSTYGRLNGAWAVVGGGGSVSWGAITGTLSSQTDLQSALDDKLPLAGGAMDTNAEITTATNTDKDSLLAGWGLGVQQTSDNTKGTTLEFDGLDTYDGSSHMVVSPTGLTFPDSTTQTTAALADAPSDGSTYGRLNGAWSAVAGGTLAADQLTAGVVTANPTTGPTASGDVLQYNGTDLVWAAGGGGGGVAWGAITGTVTDQTDLVTYVTGLGYQTSSDVSTYVGANAYPLTGNPDNFTSADLARKQAIVESVRAVIDDAGIGFNGGGNYFIPLNPGSLVNPVNNSEFASTGKWFAVVDFPNTTVPVSSVAVSSGVVIITTSMFTSPTPGRGLLYTEDGGSTWYESTFKLA
jgi:hypothetical protein